MIVSVTGNLLLHRQPLYCGFVVNPLICGGWKSTDHLDISGMYECFHFCIVEVIFDSF